MDQVAAWLKVIDRIISDQAAGGRAAHLFGWTPHSGRAGFASESIALGRGLTETKKAGRWLSDTSFRIYVDIIGASRIGTTLAAAGLTAAQAAARQQSLSYVSKDHLAAAYAAERDGAAGRRVLVIPRGPQAAEGQGHVCKGGLAEAEGLRGEV